MKEGRGASVRGWLFLVAGLAVVMALVLRWHRLDERARYYRWKFIGALNFKLTEAERVRFDRKCKAWDRLRIKYEFAAAHPWLPVNPDPPGSDPDITP